MSKVFPNSSVLLMLKGSCWYSCVYTVPLSSTYANWKSHIDNDSDNDSDSYKDSWQGEICDDLVISVCINDLYCDNYCICRTSRVESKKQALRHKVL